MCKNKIDLSLLGISCGFITENLSQASFSKMGFDVHSLNYKSNNYNALKKPNVWFKSNWTAPKHSDTRTRPKIKQCLYIISNQNNNWFDSIIYFLKSM